MREAELARPPQRQRYLSVVHVPCEHEVERSRRKEIEDVREVAQEDAEVGGLVDELLRTRPSLPVRAWIHAHDLHAPAAQLNRLALIDEEPRRGEVTERCA